jgi:hypothetical protein
MEESKVKSPHRRRLIGDFFMFLREAQQTPRSFRYARQLRWRTFPRRCPGAFCPPCKCYAFAYSGGQNVIEPKVRKQPERYVQCPSKLLGRIMAAASITPQERIYYKIIIIT